jgi:minor extracellular serine protease Vpr
VQRLQFLGRGAFLFALSVVPVFALSPKSAEPVAPAAVRAANEDVTVLVELSEPPIARYKGGIAGLPATAPEKTGITLLAARREEVARYRDHLDARQEELLERVRARVPAARVGSRYRTVFNGFALTVPAGSLDGLAKMPGVAAVHPVREYFPTLDASNPAMGAPVFWSALGGDGQAGAGMKIGVIDTGVDFSNPMFSDGTLSPPPGFPKGDAAFANGKVIVARFFQSVSDSSDTNTDPGHRTAQDLVGHGSHTAGVAGGARVDLSGSGRREITISGVAPKAWIGDYRVFAPRAFDDNIIAAIEAAVEDGMDVVNMSFGSPPVGDPLQDAIIHATENAIAAGVVATISAGNDGTDPSTIAFPAAAPHAIAVGASSNGHYGLSSLGVFEVTSGLPSVPPNLVSIVGGACSDQCSLPTSALSGPLADADAVDGLFNGIACTALPAGSLTGRIALVQRGTCTFTVKGQTVQAAGAIGMVIYNSDDPAVSNSGEQLFNPSFSQASVPALIVRRSDGLALKSFIASNSSPSAVGQMRAAPPGTPPFAGVSTPDLLTSFSSRGPTPDLQIKPDLATVGLDSYAPCQDDSPAGEDRFPAPDPHRGAGAIYNASGFDFASGTSFSAPRAAGAAALVKQKNRSWTPELVKAALTETAARPTDSGKIGLERVMSRGSGDIDLAAASTVESLVLPTSVSFGRLTTEAAPFTLSRTFTLKNQSAATVRYSIEAHSSAGDLAVTPSVQPADLTLGPGEDGTVTLRMTVGAGIAATEIDSEGFLSVSDGRMTIPEILYVPYWIRTGPLTAAEPYLRAINARGK